MEWYGSRAPLHIVAYYLLVTAIVVTCATYCHCPIIERNNHARGDNKYHLARLMLMQSLCQLFDRTLCDFM